MSNIGYKGGDVTNGKMIIALEREIGALKAKMHALEQKVKALGG